MNPSLVPALATQACIVAVLDRTPASALASLDEALAHDPDYARGYAYRYLLLRMLGRAEEMLEAVRHAIDLDPHSVLNRHSFAAALFLNNRTEEALAAEREIHAFHPRDDIALANIAVLATRLGRYGEALEAAFEAIRLSEVNPSVQALAAYAFAEAGEKGEAGDLVRQAESSRLPRAPRTILAVAHLALGNRAYALELLGRARKEHCIWLPLSRLDPRLAPLADEPRFLALFD